MSVPHTGRLKAVIDGVACHFDGDNWTCADPRLQAALNDATASSPKSHFDVRALALHVVRKLNLQDRAVLVAWTGDRWPDEVQGVD